MQMPDARLIKLPQTVTCMKCGEPEIHETSLMYLWENRFSTKKKIKRENRREICVCVYMCLEWGGGGGGGGKGS